MTFLRKTLITSLVPFLSAFAAVGETTDGVSQHFKKAIRDPKSIQTPNKTEAYSWDENVIKLGFFVEDGDKAGILERLNNEFEQDRRIIQANTGIKLELGYWSDVDPAPKVFILIGTGDQIVERAHFLADKFHHPELVNQIADAYSNGQGVCNSSVKTGANSRILSALITVDIQKQPNYCLRRQLLLAFGLLGDLPQRVKSILSLDQVELQITSLDKALLRQLYGIPK